MDSTARKIFNFLLSLFVFIFICVSILLLVAIIRTVFVYDDNPPRSRIFSDTDYISEKRGLSHRLSQSLKFETVSTEQENEKMPLMLSQFHDFIVKNFPKVHSSKLVTKHTIASKSLLYHVRGSDSTLKPYLLAGHLDVVPAEPEKWEEEPFGGVIKDGYVWGRGSMDCKHVIMGVLEALEFLLEKQYEPKRAFYLAFGHDEEIGGKEGARQISKHFERHNITFEYILDEGSFVIDNLLPRVDVPLAVVGITEKGQLNIELRVEGTPGHSSMPGKETAIVILAKALAKLEGDVFPSMFGYGPEVQMFDHLSNCVPFLMKVLFKNIWLFRPFFIRYMSQPVMNAAHRTTAAVTVINGGTKINVLPSFATAQVNLRIHPAQSVSQVKDYLRYLINDDRVKMIVRNHFEPHPVSPVDSFGFLNIKRTITQIYNDSCVVPATLLANTDTRWYLNLSKSIYRFSFLRLFPHELSRFHGVDEKISISNFEKLVNFFKLLIQNSDESYIPLKHVHDDL